MVSVVDTWAKQSRFVRELRDRALVVRRDVAMVARDLRGTRPPPFHERVASRREAHAQHTLAARSVRVVECVHETDDAVSLVLEDLRGAPFVFRPGQFFTVCVRVRGELVRRAYSASSSALEPSRLRLTVKRVPDGLVSNLLNELHEEAARGSRLELLGPSGDFIPSPSTTPRTLLLVAGGSGITPHLSILHTLLVREPQTRFVLIDGNRKEQDILFRAELDALSRQYPNRIHISYVLESPTDSWGGGVGVLDQATFLKELDRSEIRQGESVEALLCGPDAMMQAVRAALLSRGWDARRIREERFFASHAPRSNERDQSTPHRMTVIHQGISRDIAVLPNQTLLEAGVASGVAMPYSCALGGCGACKVKCVEGNVVMSEPNCLLDKERNDGYVLACVSFAASSVRVELP